jgi:hypothetical protein
MQYQRIEETSWLIRVLKSNAQTYLAKPVQDYYLRKQEKCVKNMTCLKTLEQNCTSDNIGIMVCI